VRDQAAVKEVAAAVELLERGQVDSEVFPSIPVVDVDPVSALASDMAMISKAFPERDAVSTGYRLAELDIDKRLDGSVAINDAKRVIPKPRWIRRPKVDLGVEGVRVPSQAALMGSLCKRNVGVPNNRGVVNLDVAPVHVVQRVIDTCYRADWEQVVQKHLNTGLWEANDEDLDRFLSNVDEVKARKMLDEFFLEGCVNLDRWLLMIKGKVKASRGGDTDATVDHPQTIMYLENSSTNALYSAMMRRFKICVDECLRPEVKLNAQESSEAHEAWYNSLESTRRSLMRTYCYSVDIKCYDRSQEHPALRAELEFYRRHGLSAERLKLWETMHGTKKAVSMMYGIVLTMILGGFSGNWKTLFRNGVINLMALVVSTGVTRKDVVTLDIKGDDADVEFSRPVAVETSVERMSLTFNFSAKFYTSDVRYMCKEFRLRKFGKWFFVADPWARAQSACTPVVMNGAADTLEERWISLGADLRHYDNGLLVDMVAEAAAQYYGLPVVPYGMARALSRFASDKAAFVNFFLSPERID